MKPSDVVYRTVPCDTDIVAIRAIVASTGVFRPDEIDVAVELIEERLHRGIASGYYFVFAELAGVVAGYTCFGPIACTVSSFDLYWIAVAKELQGKKIGKGLMTETEKHIFTMGGRRVYIETSSKADYVATRTFYRAHKYSIEATIKDFYDINDDKVIYSKLISLPVV
jgi:ribosomal protein S18 acetylase RimI-like enzyme